jgi:hypothetical protein
LTRAPAAPKARCHAADYVTTLRLARLADAGVLERVTRGVYALAGAGDERQGLRAAWLVLDPARSAEERLSDPVASGVASHTSAAAMHELGDLLDDRPEFTFPSRKQTVRDIRLHRGKLPASDVTLVDGLPVTTVERTIADLLRDRHDTEHVAQITGQGARRGVVDLAVLGEHLGPLARRHGQSDGAGLAEHLLDLVGLSRAAVVRDLAASPVGQELVAAGAVRAIRWLLTSSLAGGLGEVTGAGARDDLAAIIAAAEVARLHGGQSASAREILQGILDAADPIERRPAGFGEDEQEERR